ncbi:pseudaminic acid biosynthesis-associated protein PseG [Thermoanaerobacter mathranii subsp. mathranii str. A3]|uniref:Pseudaminic acid biosynthesis-associated protein PseG n=1 Tax=Thermoanaerobacter mathranii subsp. mathranii (strain DSM 11426 / CCUG 53645 / CIP 108742 / A3) TaxID=583358 RepID=A0ABM5LP66_THEM3|nr:UDP-2,4-diacetamido-2,4,6-trideoxy-beta-L-altropyranose hydrolase [Thermoanaerobacter mathranii]ADH60464.1 pseudaminic acid biosynthesis-associated protein PseG [Thermoanaerobacter mathranii subsp. mathranii str. A3]
MLKVAIRVDGGPKIGMGHITRCLALAEELANNDCNITFITRNDISSITKIKEYGFDVNVIEIFTIDEEINYITRIINQFDILITDSYEIDYNYLYTIKKTGVFLVSIDDLNEHDFPCDIVINGNIYAEDLNYKDVTGKTRFLLGPKYVLMRKEFRDLPKKQIKNKVENILITMGGSDPKGVTIKVLKALMSDRNLRSLNIDVVIGPSFNKELVTEINEFAKNNKNISTSYNVNATIMRELMIKTDIAISAGGSTLYELAAAGVPTIAVIVADNQIKNVNKWVSQHAIVKVTQISDVKNNIEKLIFDNNTRQMMSNISSSLVDGLGTIRCTKEIIYNRSKLS